MINILKISKKKISNLWKKEGENVVLVIHCCTTDYPKIRQLKTTCKHLLSHDFFGMGIWSGLSGRSSSVFLVKLQSSCQQGHSICRPDLGWICFKLTHRVFVRPYFLAGCWPETSSHVGLSLNCLGVLMT